MPDLALDDRSQDDLELLLAGAGGGSVTGVCDGGASGAGSAGEGSAGAGVACMTVPADAGFAAVGDTIRLVDPEGAPLADLAVRGVRDVAGQDSGREAPAEGLGAGAGAATDATPRVLLVGDVTELAKRVARPFESLYQPLQAGIDRLVVPLDSVPTERVLADIAQSAAGRTVVLAALVGAGSPRGISAVGLIRANLAAAELLRERGIRAQVVAVPLTGPDAGDRVASALAAYAPGEVHRPAAGGVIPGGTAAEGAAAGPADGVPEAVAAAVPRPANPGYVVLFTGLSGSGKSTIARGLRNTLLETGAPAVTLLDGDVVRRHLSAGLGFSRADRETNVARIGWVAAEISRHGGIAIASPIAPFAATRATVREMVREAGGTLVLVHVATPLAECERRDRKGLYARARAGDIPDFTGISSPYEEPTDADLTIDTSDISIDEAVDQVLAALRERGLTRG